MDLSYSLSLIEGEKLDEMFRWFLISDSSSQRMYIKLVIKLYRAGLLCGDEERLVGDNLALIHTEGFATTFERYVSEGGKMSDVAACVRMFSLMRRRDVPLVTYPMEDSYSSEFVRASRKDIYDTVSEEYGEIGSNAVLKTIATRLYGLYNSTFFGGRLPPVSIEVSMKLVTTAAQHTCERTDEIVLWNRIMVSSPIILGMKKMNRHKVGGFCVTNRTEALQLVLEHEITHMLIHLSESYAQGHRENNKAMTSHGKYFKQVIYAFFRHTDYSHSLLDNDTVSEVVVGQIVRFKDGGMEREGRVSKLNKKTARVEAGEDKWNVHYSLLY